MTSRSLKFTLLIGASLAVTACGVLDPWRGGQKIESSEDLLAAEGTWHLVEEKRIPSPVQLNQAARDLVNPDQMQNDNYTTKQAPQMMASGEDVHYRLLKMEREVQSLRRDFNKLLPPLKNLLISDAQLKRAISDVETAQGAYSPQLAQAMNLNAAKTPSMNKPSVSKPAQQMKKTAPTGAGVWRVRIGDHPGMTRLVLDLATPAAYSYDIDNNEKLLLIDLPATKWSAVPSQTFRKHPLIAGYSASDNGNGGTMLAIQLKKATKILKSAPLSSNSVHGNRIMFDLSS